MSRTIDERVVEMRFDNKQFESGVQTSLSTLEKLKKGLDLDGAAKGFDQLSTAAKRCDMSAIGRSVETVQAKFSMSTSLRWVLSRPSWRVPVKVWTRSTRSWTS